EIQPEVLVFKSFHIELPILAALFPDLHRELSFSRYLVAKVQIVAHRSSVDGDDAISGLELEFGPKAQGGDGGDFDAAPADIGYCWGDCELVHFLLLLAIWLLYSRHFRRGVKCKTITEW